MIRVSQRLRLGCALAAALLLAGCSVWQDMGDTVSDWFAPSNKSKLRGERIPLTALDDALKPDAALQATPVLLPPPYRNPEWPQPGGFASNAIYHLEASGQLRQVWDADAGKGSDIDLAPHRVAGGGRRAHLRAGFRGACLCLRRQQRPVRSGTSGWRPRTAPTCRPCGACWANPTPSSRRQGMGGGIAYDDGKIFVTSGFGVSDRAWTRATGREIWRHDLGVPIVNAPVVNGGRIFVSTHDNHFYALAEADGRNLWDHQGIAESAGILVVHQRGGVGRVRDRALHLRRALRAAGAERPGRPGTMCCRIPARSPRCPNSTTSPAGR